MVNTVLTEAVMKVSPVERPIASSAYSFMRFAGGAVAPWLAGKLAEHIAPETPFFVGAGAVAIAIVLLVSLRSAFAPADAPGVVEAVRAPQAAATSAAAPVRVAA